MGREAALRADATLLDGIFTRLAGALGDPIGGLVNTGDHLVFVFELGELGGDDAEDDVLVLGEVFERFKASGAWGVVLEIVGVYVEILMPVSICGLRNLITHLPGTASLQCCRMLPRRSDDFQRNYHGRDEYRGACPRVVRSTYCKT